MVWQSLEAGGRAPEPRWGASIVAVASETESLAVLFGGMSSGTMYNDIHVFDMKTREWCQPPVSGPAPSARWGHTATMLNAETMIVLGGRQGSKPQKLSECYLFNVASSTWSFRADLRDAPKPRYAHAALLREAQRELLLFGGHGGRSRYYQDLVTLDLNQGVWRTCVAQGAAPSKRSGHTMTLLRNRAFVVGGFNGKRYLSDVHCLDLDRMAWSSVRVAGTQFPPLMGHATTVVPGSELLLVFGGRADKVVSHTLYAIDTQMRLCTAVTRDGVAAPRAHHSSCVLGEYIVCFGGSSECAAFNDLLIAPLLQLSPSLSNHEGMAEIAALTPPPTPEDQRSVSRSATHSGGGLWRSFGRRRSNSGASGGGASSVNGGGPMPPSSTSSEAGSSIAGASVMSSAVSSAVLGPGSAAWGSESHEVSELRAEIAQLRRLCHRYRQERDALKDEVYGQGLVIEDLQRRLGDERASEVALSALERAFGDDDSQAGVTDDSASTTSAAGTDSSSLAPPGLEQVEPSHENVLAALPTTSEHAGVGERAAAAAAAREAALGSSGLGGAGGGGGAGVGAGADGAGGAGLMAPANASEEVLREWERMLNERLAEVRNVRQARGADAKVEEKQQ